MGESGDTGQESRDTMIGIIGGSGLYGIDGLDDVGWTRVETPWGDPSDEILTGRLRGLPIAFLPRHGRGHAHSPSSVPYRANIDALKRLGVTDAISFSAAGSLREDMAPGHFVNVTQYVDRTVGRDRSFFGKGCVAHVSIANPTCARLGEACVLAARDAGATVHDSGTYLAMEGPQFSTLAESRMYRESWNCDVIGMTNMPEARLAREAEICYASVAMVTDYDSWHPRHGEVDIRQIVETLNHNVEAARKTILGLAERLGAESAREPCTNRCDRALEHAILTSPDSRDPALVAKLDAVAGRALGG